MRSVYSRRKHTKKPTVYLRKTIDLPPELLSIIFKFVHDSTPRVQLQKDIIPAWMHMDGPDGLKQSVKAIVHPKIPEDRRLKSRTLFPYSLAAVCSFWRDILSYYPEFWRVIVLFIDSKPTPLVDAALFLEWSREEEIDVFITRREGLRPTFHPDLHEKSQIDALLHILKPHLHRCRSFHVDAHLSSSLPITSFDGIAAPCFKSLELLCDAHADAEVDVDGGGDDYSEDFEPQLRRLTIDGKNFCEHSELLNYWLSTQRRTVPLKQLTIAQYKPGKNNGYGFKDFFINKDGPDFLEADQLKLESLQFAGDSLSGVLPRFDSRFIHFEDLTEGFITDISQFADFAHLCVLRITRCPLPSLHNITPDTLILEEISEDVDLLRAVTDWQGQNLWLDRCYSFPGSFLEALRCRRPDLGTYPCSEMHRLLLYRLPNFSIVSLKMLIERRNSYVHYSHPNWKTVTDFGPAISHLAVVRCGKGKLSAKDLAWFRSRLVEFYWVP